MIKQEQPKEEIAAVDDMDMSSPHPHSPSAAACQHIKDNNSNHTSSDNKISHIISYYNTEDHKKKQKYQLEKKEHQQGLERRLLYNTHSYSRSMQRNDTETDASVPAGSATGGGQGEEGEGIDVVARSSSVNEVVVEEKGGNLESKGDVVDSEEGDGNNTNEYFPTISGCASASCCTTASNEVSVARATATSERSQLQQQQQPFNIGDAERRLGSSESIVSAAPDNSGTRASDAVKNMAAAHIIEVVALVDDDDNDEYGDDGGAPGLRKENQNDEGEKNDHEDVSADVDDAVPDPPEERRVVLPVSNLLGMILALFMHYLYWGRWSATVAVQFVRANIDFFCVSLRLWRRMPLLAFRVVVHAIHFCVVEVVLRRILRLLTHRRQRGRGKESRGEE